MRRVVLLCLAICASPAVAGLDDTTRARAALEQGEVLPLVNILGMVEKEVDARVIEVEFEEENGKYIYEFELITPDGRLLEAIADAVTGQILVGRGGRRRRLMRALAVEDDPRIVRDLTAALAGAGFRVET